MVYPAEYGFVPDTLDDDGGPLDVLVLTEYPTFAGCGIKAKILGMCVVTDEHGRDCKLLCVPVYDAKWKDATDITDVPKALLDKISHFFNTYKDLEETGWTKVEGWSGREEALKELAASRRRRAG
jgi:inorganic pyrophosphatase